MMATTIRQAEAIPSDYGDAPPGLSSAAAALDPDLIWSRIDSYIAWRFTPRAVTWIVTGPGEWHPPLTPATIATSEAWTGSGWETATPDPSPLGGFLLPGYGPFRFTASVGGGEPPAAVIEATRRLAEYMASKPGTAGARSERIEAGTVSIDRVRSESWMALALQNSGAADLLRPYRKA